MAILLHGDAAAMLRSDVPTASVDMVYLDPPFGNQQDWKGAAGAFSDKWEWDAAARERHAWLRERHPTAAMLFDALPLGARERSYLAFIAELLAELRRVLRLTGSLWLHCDDTMGAYIRLMLDAVFGAAQFLGIVIWKRTSAHSTTSNSFGRIHDSIFAGARSRATRFRLARCRMADPVHGAEIDEDTGESATVVVGDPLSEIFVDGFCDDHLNPSSKERVGYPTQKPVALIERLVRAATLPGDLVLDPVCGSGTTLVAATTLGRRAIGIDRSTAAIKLAGERVEGAKPRQLGLFGLEAPNPRRALA